VPIDFQLPPDVEEVRQRVRSFMHTEVRPVERKLQTEEADGNGYRHAIVALRQKAHSQGLWNRHLPKEWDGMDLGPVGMAFASADAGRTCVGPFIINAQAPDEGNYAYRPMYDRSQPLIFSPSSCRKRSAPFEEILIAA
jgi:acyl-CoA dehydrogenase